MADALVPGTMMDFTSVEKNPEALFDILSIKTFQDRYGNLEPARRGADDPTYQNDPAFHNEAEFESFVRQFPIDDSIAECFAMATVGHSSENQESKFVSGGKRPQGSSKYNKLKKKLGWKQADDNLLTDDDTRSRDSKRSKKGGVFSKRHKWRNAMPIGCKKSVNFSDQSESDNVGDVIDEARREISSVYQKQSVPVTYTTDSNSDSPMTSFSETFAHDVDQRVPLFIGTGHLDAFTRRYHGSHLSDDVIDESHDDFMTILSGDSSSMIQKMEDIEPEDAMKLRDHHGNTLLHRCVMADCADAVKFILEKYPEMTSHMNAENETAIELAAKTGRYESLSVILERGARRNSLGPAVVNRLVNICAQNGKAECLNLLLIYLQRDPQRTCSLPGDIRGNTAAHLAAKYGHLQCLQTLVTSGYDVTSENRLHQRPLQVAHQNRSHACFQYLLVLTVCQQLLATQHPGTSRTHSRQSPCPGEQSTISHVKQCLTRFRTLFTETKHSLTESRDNIIQTLGKLQGDLERFIQHTSADSAMKRREAKDKLEELTGEIERLEDALEFSPVEKMENALGRLLTSLEELVTSSREEKTSTPEVTVLEDRSGEALSALIKDVHKEFVLENWDMKHVLERYTGRTPDSRSTLQYGQPNSTNNTATSNINSTSQYGQSNGANNTTTSNINSTSHNSCKDNTKVPSRSVKSIDKSTDTDDLGQLVSMHTVNSITNENTVSPSVCRARELDNDIGKDTAADTTDAVHIKVDEHDKNKVGENYKNISDHDKENVHPTERPFAKLMSLEDRMDMLIAGERARERREDLDSSNSSGTFKGSPEQNVYGSLSDHTSSPGTLTFTSVTSQSTSETSEWFSKLGFSSLESATNDVPGDVTNVDGDVTSDSASYWWDGDDRQRMESSTTEDNESVCDKEHVKLTVDNEDSSFEDLRRQRLVSHLHAVQQSRYATDEFREQITTASGEIIGGFPTGGAERIVVDVNGALKRREGGKPVPKARRTLKQKMSSSNDAVPNSQMNAKEVQERSRRSRDRITPISVKWEDMYFTDDDEIRSISWSDLPDYNRSSRWHRDTPDSSESSSVTPQSFV